MTIDDKLDSKKIKVLIVDDRQENIDAYSTAIKENFPMFEPDFSYNKTDAIEKLAQNQYDMVITDRVMETEYSGFEVFDECLKKGLEVYMVTEFEHSGQKIFVGPLDDKKGDLLGAKNNKEDIKKVLSAILEKYNNPDSLLESKKRYQKFVKLPLSGPVLKLYRKTIILQLRYGKEYLKLNNDSNN